ncbi:MAG: benzoate/H(+) symporter BenE family transporter [Geminicoccaceae bacterium]
MRASIVISALVAVLVGFGGSVAIILAAAKAVGATPDQTSSWVAALCLSMMATTAILSIYHRLPIVTAWSTPGAALIATSSGINMETAVGAFFLAGGLILVTALFRPLSMLIERIPGSIASAMLAGVLFSFVIAVFGHVQHSPALVLPILLTFAILRPYSPAWAVILVLAAGIALAYALGLTEPLGDIRVSSFVWVSPTFDVAALVGIGLPLYLVTMASQNLPGFAVLRAAGYTAPTQSILAVTGLASLLTAGLTAHTSNLAAITASICTGAEAHPDKDKRWLCGPVYALGYGILAVFGASLVTVFASFPETLIVTIAGVALIGPFINALQAGLEDENQRFAATTTFLVTASGVDAFGIGSAFWGLVAGLAVVLLEGISVKRQRRA